MVTIIAYGLIIMESRTMAPSRQTTLAARNADFSPNRPFYILARDVFDIEVRLLNI